MKQEIRVQQAAVSREKQRLIWNELYLKEGRRYGESPSVAAQLALPELKKLAHRLNSKERLTKPNEFTFRKPSLLELGCGYGRDVLFFKRFLPALLVMAVDWADSAILLLQSELAKNNISDIKIALGDVLKDPLDGSHFDVIYSNYLFHYLDPKERRLLLKRCSLKLTKGGLFIASFVSKTDERFLRNKEVSDNSVEVYPDRVWHFFGESEIHEDLGSHGFRCLYPLKEVAELEKIGSTIELTTFWFVMAQKE